MYIKFFDNVTQIKKKFSSWVQHATNLHARFDSVAFIAPSLLYYKNLRCFTSDSVSVGISNDNITLQNILSFNIFKVNFIAIIILVSRKSYMLKKSKFELKSKDIILLK